jgi:glucose/arabinose dehydrogenase
MPSRFLSSLVVLGCAVFAAAATLPVAFAAPASVNAGNNEPNPAKPFKETAIATFDTPWAIAFLPDGRMLVSEKPGRLFLVTQKGDKTEVTGVPKVHYGGQNGLLDVAVSPKFPEDKQIYFTYAEPGNGGSSLALARAVILENGKSARLDGLNVIWRQMPKGSGGQPGGIVAFSPDGQYLFLTSGDRMRPKTAQDPEQALGKVLRLNLDGSTPKDNPWAKDGGVRAQTWTMGHRNPYGLAFGPDGKLWEDEMGPKGGDELNPLEPGRNYGWPVVSNGDNYDGTPIPDHDTHPEFAPPVVYWNPVIAPAGLAFYNGNLFPEWKGSAFIGGLAADALVRIAFSGDGSAREADRWDMGHRIRDVAVAPDGALWLIEDEDGGRLLRLTPK